MGFLGVYSAVYDYQPQGEGELEIHEGDLLYILEKNADDDWWKAKKKAEPEEEEEPEGLVPNNYVQEVSLQLRTTLCAEQAARGQMADLDQTGGTSAQSYSPLRLHATDRRRGLLLRRC
jgi:hypothetical protein